MSPGGETSTRRPGDVHVGELRLRRFVAGELLGAAGDEVGAHVAVCPACRARLDHVGDEQRQFARDMPFERFAGGVERARRVPRATAPLRAVFGGFARTAAPLRAVFGGFARTAAPRRAVFGGFARTAAPRRAVFGGFVRAAAPLRAVFGGFARAAAPRRAAVFGGFALAAAVALLVVMPAERGGHNLTKGGAVDVTIRIGGPAGQRDASARNELAPGERLRFGHRAHASRHLVIVSVDERGEVSTLYPERGPALSLQPAAEATYLPGSIELLGPGRERVFAVVSEAALEVATVAAAARAAYVAARGDLSASSLSSGGWEVSTWLFAKPPSP